MYKLITLTTLLLSSSVVLADNQDDLISGKDCGEVKEAIGYFLGVADYLFNEIEKIKFTDESEVAKKEKETELFEGAMAMSELAANYSTVYDVWCKSHN